MIADKNRFMEQASRNYWNDFFIAETQKAGYVYHGFTSTASFLGKAVPSLSYVIMQNVVLLYSNQYKVAYYEVFDWDTQTIYSFVVDANESFWGMSGFDKLKALEKKVDGITLRDKTERQWF